MKRALAILGVSGAAAATTLAAPPKLDSLWPPGARKGSEIEIKLEGKFEPWPCQLHFSSKGFSFVPDPEKSGVGMLKIAKDVPSGPVLIRAHSEEGASSPVIFVVDDLPEIEEKEEDKSTLDLAQPVDANRLPVAVNGRLSANNELDSFRIDLKKGNRLFAAVEGYALRSPVDPALHIYDSSGNRLLLSHDGAVTLDPLAHFEAPSDGAYTVSVAGFAHPPATSVHFRGDKTTRYRLYLARKREELPSRLLPRNLEPDAGGTSLAVGRPTAGTLLNRDETDSYQFAATKGQEIFVRVEAFSLGFPTDPVLRILNPDGSELRTVDDTGKSPDPTYLWKVASDGEYSLNVTDRFRRGGPELRYRLTIDDVATAFTATPDKSEYTFQRGKPLDIKIKIARLNGHKADLEFAIPELPETVKLSPPDKVPEKGGDVLVKLTAGENAEGFSQPVSIRISEKSVEGSPVGEPVIATFSFQDKDSRGPYAIDETSEIWLTLPPLEKEEPEKDEAKEEAAEKTKG